ncbi:PREDICTED: late embryogenesis abundant protein 2-like isoform X2 [Fragaria vesca subsp. vesca]|uniref:late embryogenesis abundant protein 2-like isoform X2 n=1 Tax=Fragaria vesca subsp. vesca TaxID=101020 RepID=UPI0002C310C3|nr:PREDICTED: late embryogenesis abundant protein 2-like isoform X2 [Fragaria vesca subsp. vesca]
MDNSQKVSYQAGEAKGQTQEKASTMMDKAGNAVQSAKESLPNAGPTNSQKASYQTGEAKGQTQEKASTMMDKAGNAAQTAKESVQNAGQTIAAGAAGAVDAVKNATGMNK